MNTRSIALSIRLAVTLNATSGSYRSLSRADMTLVQLPNEDGSYYYRIVDGNLKGKPSANGLLINGRKLQAHDLRDQDRVIFGPQVQATYYLLRRDAITTVPPDEYDITLISPNMTGEPEDDTAARPVEPASDSLG